MRDEKEEITRVLDDTYKTKRTLSKDPTGSKKMSNQSLLTYCEKTINICKIALELMEREGI